MIACVWRTNENAGNLISVVQFLINMYTYIYIYMQSFAIEGQTKVYELIIEIE